MDHRPDLAGVTLQENERNGRPPGIRFQFTAQTWMASERTVVAGDREAFAKLDLT